MRYFLLLTLLFIFSCSSSSVVKSSKEPAAKAPVKEIAKKKPKAKSKLNKVRVYVLPPQAIKLSEFAINHYTDADVSEAAALRAFRDGIDFYQYKDAGLDLVVRPINSAKLRLKKRKIDGASATTYEPESLAAFCKANKLLIDENAYILCVGKLSIEEANDSKKKNDFIDSKLDFVLLNTSTGEASQLGNSTSYITYPKYTVDELKSLGQKTIDQILEQILFVD